MNADVGADLVKAIQITELEMSLGVHQSKAVHGLCIYLKDLSQRGWAKGYSEGWAAAIVRVLEQRDVTVSDEIDGYLTTRTDLKALTEWLDLAITVTKAKDLFADGQRST
jgi:hypothetical protein